MPLAWLRYALDFYASTVTVAVAATALGVGRTFLLGNTGTSFPGDLTIGARLLCLG